MTDISVDPSSPAPDGIAEFLPIRTLDMEIGAELAPIQAADPRSGLRFGSALVLVRLGSEPLGLAKVALPAEGLNPDQLVEQIWTQLREPILTATSRSGISIHTLTAEGLPQAVAGGYRKHRQAALQATPAISAVICTRDRPERLRACLTAMSQQDHPRYTVIVVDNAPSTDATASVVEEMRDLLPVRRVVEPLPGLSRARNTGIRTSSTELIAFLDDDELPDQHWLSEMALGFAEGDDVGCVTGMILPASLETRAQAWFEEYGGHSKNRGFTQMVFNPRDRTTQHPLYPLPPYGAGGNMSFRRGALLAIGGFDPALGAGTPTRAAEDTAAFADVMLKGYRLVYRPSALLWHNHYQTFDDLRRQLNGYGSGLTAYFVRIVLRRPWLLSQLLGLAPRGIRDLFGRDSQRFSSIEETFPQELLADHRRGMIWGLIAYPYTLWHQRAIPRQKLDST